MDSFDQTVIGDTGSVPYDHSYLDTVQGGDIGETVANRAYASGGGHGVDFDRLGSGSDGAG